MILFPFASQHIAILPLWENKNQSRLMKAINRGIRAIADNTYGSSYGYRMSKVALSMAGKSLAHDLINIIKAYNDYNSERID
jgi:hypothetical protein